MDLIDSHIEKILENYTTGEHYELLKRAKEIYIQQTGKLDDETDEYESRMNSFNDWYIFNFRKDNERRVIDDYIQDFSIDDELAKAFHNINYSLFHFVKINFRKQVLLKDILHDEKVALSKDHVHMGIVEDDLFVGRVICYQGQNYLLRGLCTVPNTVLGKLKKEAKRVRKLSSAKDEEKFLLQIERQKTKSLQYSHLDAAQIFTFQNPS